MTRLRQHRPRHSRTAATLATGAMGLLLTALAAPSAAAYDDYAAGEVAGYDAGYSYIRVLDGSATLIQDSDYGDPGDGERDQAAVNQPVLAGDRLWVAPRSRAEVLLSDGNLLRLDADSEALFESLAFSPESSDRVTTLRLLRGNAQLVVVSDSLGDQLPRLDTPNATVYPQDYGTYRVTTESGDWTEVVVRRGRAEVVSGAGVVTVDADRRALVEGADRPWTDVQAASGYDHLEQWAADLDRRARDASPYVDDDLRYAAAPLDDHGRWVEVSGNYAWKPRVETGWRPYWHGRWSYTPAGLNWISYEPWGWVPYHYGSWDYAPGYGWVWYPGRRFAPSWVYWHWGSSHVAWVPIGYYTRHYRHDGFRFGVYGWAGGHHGAFADWVFCERIFFGRRFQRRHHFHGHDWHRRHGGRDVPRGILTTDTRPLTPRHWRDGMDALRVLRTRPGGAGRIVDQELPDVTPFVARRGRTLPEEVERRVAVTRGDVDRVAGTPLAPGTDAPRVRRAVPRTGVRPDTTPTPRGEDGPGVRARAGVTRAPVPDRGPGTAAGSDSSGRRAGRPGGVQRTTPRSGTRAEGAPDTPSGSGEADRGEDRRRVTRAPAPRRDEGATGQPGDGRRPVTRAPAPRRDPGATAQPGDDRRPVTRAPAPRRDGAAGERGTARDERATAPRTDRGETRRAPRPSSARRPASSPRSSPRAQAPTRSRSAPSPRAQAPSRSRSQPAPRAQAPSRSRSQPAPRAQAPSRSRSAPRAQAPSRSRGGSAPRARTPSRSRGNSAPRAQAPSRSRGGSSSSARAPSRSRGGDSASSRSSGSPSRRSESSGRSNRGGSRGSARPR